MPSVAQAEVVQGATFSKGKYMVLGGDIIGTITTFISKDCLLAEVYETN